jgi:hypothetical protein
MNYGPRVADDDGDQAAEGRSQVERVLPQWLREIQRSVASLSNTEREELARHLRDFAQLREVAPAVNTWAIGPDAQLESWPVEALGADHIILLGDTDQAIGESLVTADPGIVKSENVSKLA